MISRVSLVFFLLFFTAFSAAFELKNGDFEAGKSYWNYVFDSTKHPTFEVTSENCASGQCISIVLNDSERASLSQRIGAIDSGIRYTLSTEAYSPVGSSYAIGLSDYNWRNAACERIGKFFYSAYKAGEGQWTQFAHTIDVPASDDCGPIDSTHNWYVYLYAVKPSEKTYFDNVAFAVASNEEPTPTPEPSNQPETYCGDYTCQETEDCQSCSIDCGDCQQQTPEPSNQPETYCGDYTCQETEDCQACPYDCGECPCVGDACASQPTVEPTAQATSNQEYGEELPPAIESNVVEGDENQGNEQGVTKEKVKYDRPNLGADDEDGAAPEKKPVGTNLFKKMIDSIVEWILGLGRR